MKIYSWVEYILGTQGGGKPTIGKTDVGKSERAGIASPAHGVPEDGAHQQVPAEKKELHVAGTAGLSFQDVDLQEAEGATQENTKHNINWSVHERGRRAVRGTKHNQGQRSYWI
jgi:hypothetical protein